MTQKETSKDDPDPDQSTGGAAASGPAPIATPPIEIDVHDESDRYRGKAQNARGANAGTAAQDS